MSDLACETEDSVISLIRNRGDIGRAKYGVSMDRRDLSPVEWLQHLQEELADGLQYAERAKAGATLLESAVAIMEALKHERDWDCASEWLAEYQKHYPSLK